MGETALVCRGSSFPVERIEFRELFSGWSGFAEIAGPWIFAEQTTAAFAANDPGASSFAVLSSVCAPASVARV
jgi:hypothetical protein